MKCTYFIENKKRFCQKQVLKNCQFCSVHNFFSNECSICYEQLNKEQTIKLLPCKHIFHKCCIVNINTNNCPLCRTFIENTPKELLEKLINKNETSEHTEEELMNYIRYIHDQQNEKKENYNNFCSYSKSQTVLAIDKLKKLNIPLKYLPNYIYIKKNINQLHNNKLCNYLIIRTLQNLYMDITKKKYEECLDHEYFNCQDYI